MEGEEAPSPALARHVHTGCDNVVGLDVVLANGTVVTANSTSHPDLYWASCGGGGGTFGITTYFHFKVSVLPNEGRLTQLSVSRTARGERVQTRTRGVRCPPPCALPPLPHTCR